MIEMREAVPFPYKGYIFCESEDEANFCLEEVQKSLQAWQVSNVRCGLSHGCSEYGLKYPKFKYSSDGAHHSFERPTSWDQLESDFYAVTQKPRIERKDYNKQGITIRDMLGFRAWIDYAEIIGDESSRMFRDSPTSDKQEPFATRIRKQSQLRKAQMEELREIISSKS